MDRLTIVDEVVDVLGENISSGFRSASPSPQKHPHRQSCSPSPKASTPSSARPPDDGRGDIQYPRVSSFTSVQVEGDFTRDNPGLSIGVSGLNFPTGQPSPSPVPDAPFAWQSRRGSKNSDLLHPPHYPADSDPPPMQLCVRRRSSVAEAAHEAVARPTLRYCVALVLNDSLKTSSRGKQGVYDMHESIVTALLAAGLNPVLLHNDTPTSTEVVIVLNARDVTEHYGNGHDLWYLARESEEIRKERLNKQGIFFTHKNSKDLDGPDITPAAEIRLTLRIVKRALSNINEGEDGKLREYPSNRPDKSRTPLEQTITALFPIHDAIWNQEFFRKMNTRYNLVGSQKKFDPVSEIQKQFGERVGFYFAYVQHYTKWLAWLTLLTLPYYLISRNVSYRGFAAGMAPIGWFIACVWSTLMNKNWVRKSERLAMKWVQEDKDTNFKNMHNPSYVHEPIMDEDGTFMGYKKIYDPGRNRLLVFLSALPVVLINLFFLSIVTVPFIQWYVYGKMAPSCDCCEWILQSGYGNGSIPLPIMNMTEAFQGSPVGCAEQISSYTNFDPELAPPRCSWWKNCFDGNGTLFVTDRWYYILLQGMAFGLFLDVIQYEFFKAFTTWLVKLENWETDAQFSKSLITKQYFFLWYNMYFWFLFLAFVYVPYGPWIQGFLKDLGAGWIVPSWGWREAIIEIDEAFVNPLVATQIINLCLETLIPVAMTKFTLSRLRSERRHRANNRRLGNGLRRVRSKLRHIPSMARAALAATRVGGQSSRATTLDPSGLPSTKNASKGSGQPAEQPSSPQTLSVPLGNTPPPLPNPISNAANGHMVSTPMDNGGSSYNEPTTSNDLADSQSCTNVLHQRFLAMEVATGISMIKLMVHTDDQNEYDATDILGQSRQTPYDPHSDYLDMMMQFGYVCNFTQAWALLPTAAFINNHLEVRGDLVKLCWGSQRPFPYPDTGIGPWQLALDLTSWLAVVVSAGLITLATGQLDYWYSDCGRHLEIESMSPDLSCLGTAHRLFWALVVEHVGFAVIAWLRVLIKPTPKQIQDHRSTQKELLRIKRRVVQQPTLPKQIELDLQYVFDYYKTPGTKSISVDKCLELFQDLKGGTFSKHHLNLVFIANVSIASENQEDLEQEPKPVSLNQQSLQALGVDSPLRFAAHHQASLQVEPATKEEEGEQKEFSYDELCAAICRVTDSPFVGKLFGSDWCIEDAMVRVRGHVEMKEWRDKDRLGYSLSLVP